jgi:hypothetical protein
LLFIFSRASPGMPLSNMAGVKAVIVHGGEGFVTNRAREEYLNRSAAVRR